MTEAALVILPMKAKTFHITGFEICFYLQLEKSKIQKNFVPVMISAAAISKSDLILNYNN